MIMIIIHCGQQSEKSSFHAKINYADFVHFLQLSPRISRGQKSELHLLESRNNEI